MTYRLCNKHYLILWIIVSQKRGFFWFIHLSRILYSLFFFNDLMFFSSFFLGVDRRTFRSFLFGSGWTNLKEETVSETDAGETLSWVLSRYGSPLANQRWANLRDEVGFMSSTRFAPQLDE